MSVRSELKLIGITRIAAAGLCKKNVSTLRSWHKDNPIFWDIVKRGIESKLRDESADYKRFIIFDTSPKNSPGLIGINTSTHTLEEARVITLCMNSYQIIDRDTWRSVG